MMLEKGPSPSTSVGNTALSQKGTAKNSDGVLRERLWEVIDVAHPLVQRASFFLTW
jgi:hypothetical protein